MSQAQERIDQLTRFDLRALTSRTGVRTSINSDMKLQLQFYFDTIMLFVGDGVHSHYGLS